MRLAIVVMPAEANLCVHLTINIPLRMFFKVIYSAHSLDEPNANLDEKGEQALVGAMVESTKKGNSVIIISHRPAILAFVDMIMVLQDGMIVAYGPKEEIMAKLSQAQKNPTT